MYLLWPLVDAAPTIEAHPVHYIQDHPQDSRSYIQTKIILKIQVGLIMLGSLRVGWGVQSCRMRLSPMPNGSDVRVCQDIASCTCYGLR